MQKSEVLNISFSSVSEIFTLETSTGVKYARIVVLATGASVKPGLPVGNPFTGVGKGSVSHAFASDGILPAQMKRKIAAGKQTNVAGTSTPPTNPSPALSNCKHKHTTPN